MISRAWRSAATRPTSCSADPLAAYERLARAQRLAPLPIDGSPVWSVARRAVIGLVAATGGENRAAPAPNRGGVAFDDPRNDPVSLAWAEAQLANRPFDEGYAGLVRAAGTRRRIGRQPGSAAAAVERGEAERAPAVVSGDPPVPAADALPGSKVSPSWPAEDIGLCATSFLRFLGESGQAGPASRCSKEGTSRRPRTAGGPARRDAGRRPGRALGGLVGARTDGLSPDKLQWMTEPPPWPPASIAKILTREGEQAMAMVETLAGQLAPDPRSRSWLIRSWLVAAARIDRDDPRRAGPRGRRRLVREPRFRAWLRAEWTAWARQRYRRVCDVAGRRNSSGQATRMKGH